MAGHSLNRAEKPVLGPGNLDMTSKGRSSVEGSFEPAIARRTLAQATLTPMAFRTYIITYLPNMEFAPRLAIREKLLKRRLILQLSTKAMEQKSIVVANEA